MTDRNRRGKPSWETFRRILGLPGRLVNVLSVFPVRRGPAWVRLASPGSRFTDVVSFPRELEQSDVAVAHPSLNLLRGGRPSPL